MTAEPAESSSTPPPSPASGAGRERPRLFALDAFRGFDIAAMLFVNMTWDRAVFHPQFFHVEWNNAAQGATFTDLVFPWFVFIAGCAIPLSMRSGRGASQPTGSRIVLAARRALVLYLLGVLLTVAGQADQRALVWTDVLSWNILQLIALAYFCAVLLWQLPRPARIASIPLILVAKLATLALIPYDLVEQAGLVRAPEGAPLGAGTWAHMDGVKRLLHMEHRSGLGPALLGWLGMSQQFLPLAAAALLGGMATEVLTSDRSVRVRALRLAALGVGLTALGYVMQWGYEPSGGGLLGTLTFPFSKWIFTPSYILLASGTGVLLLLGFWLVADVWKLSSLWGLRVMGMNAIALYVGAELFFKLIFAEWLMPGPGGAPMTLASGVQAWVGHWTASGAWAGWVFVLSWLGAWWVVCAWLHARRIYIKV